ncbi:MAG: serine hydrolase domain-containing protein [Gemmatimonadota bacterium]
MTRWLTVWVVGVGLGSPLTACSPVDSLADGAPLPLSETSPRLQAAIDTWAATAGHRGVSAAVILASGEEWVGAAGTEAAGAELGPEHLIWIASITKTMTGAVILQLAEEGVLDLEDPVSRWLPTLPNVDPDITLRQLLNHTNGLANYTASAALGAAIDADPLHRFTPLELLAYVGPPSFVRGQRTQYTNTSFLLLGMVAEAATGEAITDLYAERLWAPLGLTEVFLPGAQAAPAPVAVAWAGQSAENAVAPLDWMSLVTIGQSAFGLFSNARTVARWGRALFTGSVLQPTTRARMLELVPAAGNIPGESGAGLGIRAYGYLGRTQYGHSGGVSLGSSLLLFDPESGITVAVLMNQGSGAAHFSLAPRLLEIAAGR